MRLIRGKIIARNILAKMYKEVRQNGIAPGLAVIWVGNDKASKIYINLKKKAAEKIGMKFYLYRFNEKNKTADVVKKINLLNQNKNVQGIIVQLPLPKKFNTEKIIQTIDPEKDADGFSAKGGSASGGHQNDIRPVFPTAIIRLIESCGKEEKGKRAIVVARSKKFGEVMVEALQKNGMKGEHILIKGCEELKGAKEKKRFIGSIEIEKIKKADIVITACGIPGLISGAVIKKGAIIIDGGITKIGKKVWGDVDLMSVKKIARDVSPVPGGVGPVTVAGLIENVILLSKKTKPVTVLVRKKSRNNF